MFQSISEQNQVEHPSLSRLESSFANAANRYYNSCIGNNTCVWTDRNCAEQSPACSTILGTKPSQGGDSIETYFWLEFWLGKRIEVPF